MSKFSKKDNFKTKKQEQITSKKDATNKQTTILKKQTATGITKTTSNAKETTSRKKDENDRLKGNKTLNVLPTNNKLDTRNIALTTVEKKEPIRAKQSSNFLKNLTANPSSRINIAQAPKKRNAVLDTPHNVTVSSPPPKRTDKATDKVRTTNKVPLEVQNISKSKSENRKNSRTLAPEEIIILKKDANCTSLDGEAQLEAVTVKDPVAFEVKFEEKAKTKTVPSNLNKKPLTDSAERISLIENDNVEQNYSDDFETYESDFETESSTQSVVTTDQSSTSSDDVLEKYSETNSQHPSTIDDSEDESEITQNPVTVIHKVNEKKLDSGHYEMNSQNSNTLKSADMYNSLQHVTDSKENFSLGISDQLDSGISACELTEFPDSCNKGNIEFIFGGYKDFYRKPIINQRSVDLMLKIQFDVLSFKLFELKPISYDVFMQTYGKLNTQQSLTQTEDNLFDAEQQTDFIETHTKWTQHPVHYDFKAFKDFNQNQICCGESLSETYTDTMPECKLEQSWQKLKLLNGQNSKQVHQKSQRVKSFDYNNLNSFLLRTSIVLNQILSSPNNSTSKLLKQPTEYEEDKILSRISDKYYCMNTTFLNTLKVLKIFSNNKYNLLITVHESLPDSNVYSSDFSNLMMVWSINVTDKPLRLLTTWSQVSKIEISNDSSDIIVAALRDGSIALWDLRETYSFCSKLDGHLTHFAATQSVVPSLHGIKIKSESTIDLGSCLDIKSFKSQHNTLHVRTKFPETQFVSLHDSGVLTIWTLIQTSDANLLYLAQTKNAEKPKSFPILGQTFEFISPWARIKLIQSTIFNVKDYLETKSQQTQSRFDKTKTLFQKNIYSDEVLKELNQASLENEQQGLRFTSLECGCNNLFICTNRNFILMCSKTLKMDRLKRIMINENRFLFPTALKVLNNENFVAVGLSNGAVIIINCQSKKQIQNQKLMKTPKKDPTFSLNTETITGKSCAIQNIVLNSQKVCEDFDFNQQQQQQEHRPNTAAFVSLIESKRQPFELRILDQQIIMNGTVLRKNLIQTLELSSDGWKLFALTNGHIRVYDFYLDNEIAYQEMQETGKIIDISTGNCGNDKMSLMILKPNAQVEVYLLKK